MAHGWSRTQLGLLFGSQRGIGWRSYPEEIVIVSKHQPNKQGGASDHLLVPHAPAYHVLHVLRTEARSRTLCPSHTCLCSSHTGCGTPFNLDSRGGTHQLSCLISSKTATDCGVRSQQAHAPPAARSHSYPRSYSHQYVDRRSIACGSRPVSSSVPASAFTMAPMDGWLVRPWLVTDGRGGWQHHVI
jgi:hypothetical protein